MVTLTCVIKNGDAHLKNFGVLYDKPGVNVRLAPVYDMLSTLPYQPRDVLALQIDGSKQFPSRKQLGQFGRQSCGLSSRKVEMILAQVAIGVSRAGTDIRKYAGSNPDFQASAEILSNVFSGGLEALGLAYSAQ